MHILRCIWFKSINHHCKNINETYSLSKIKVSRDRLSLFLCFEIPLRNYRNMRWCSKRCLPSRSIISKQFSNKMKHYKISVYKSWLVTHKWLLSILSGRCIHCLWEILILTISDVFKHILCKWCETTFLLISNAQQSLKG